MGKIINQLKVPRASSVVNNTDGNARYSIRRKRKHKQATKSSATFIHDNK